MSAFDDNSFAPIADPRPERFVRSAISQSSFSRGARLDDFYGSEDDEMEEEMSELPTRCRGRDALWSAGACRHPSSRRWSTPGWQQNRRTRFALRKCTPRLVLDHNLDPPSGVQGSRQRDKQFSSAVKSPPGGAEGRGMTWLTIR